MFHFIDAHYIDALVILSVNFVLFTLIVHKTSQFYP